MLRAGVDPTDTAAVIGATANLPLEVSDDPDSTQVIFDGEDVSRVIREDEVTRNVSAVSAIPEVRQNLVELQRTLAARAHRAIVEGRDIGTVVLADAPAKAFMTASAEVRAQRRHDQNLACLLYTSDAADSSRTTSPLRPAEDAVLVDTSSMTRDEVLEALVDLIKESADD